MRVAQTKKAVGPGCLSRSWLALYGREQFWTDFDSSDPGEDASTSGIACMCVFLPFWKSIPGVEGAEVARCDFDIRLESCRGGNM